MGLRMWRDDLDIDEFVHSFELNRGTIWPRKLGPPPLPASDREWQEFCWRNSREQFIAQFGSEELARAHLHTLSVADARRQIHTHPFLEWALNIAPKLLEDDWGYVSEVPFRLLWAPSFYSAACRRIADDAYVILIFMGILYNAVDLNQHMWHFLLDFEPGNPRARSGISSLFSFYRSRMRMLNCSRHIASFPSPVPPRWRLATHQVLARKCARLQALFVVLHELAHVFHRHLDRLRSVNISSCRQPAELKVAASHDIEFEADRTAYQWLMHLREQPSLAEGTGVKPNQGAIQFAIETAIETFFADMAVIGRWERGDYGSHPPPIERARRLTLDTSLNPCRSEHDWLGAHVRLMRLEMWALPSDFTRIRMRKAEIESLARRIPRHD